MKKILFTLLSCLAILAADPFRELGSITTANGIQWTHSDTNVTGFNVFLGELATNRVVVTNEFSLIQTNEVLIARNFARVANVSTNRWPGDVSKAWFGIKPLYVTAFTVRGEESGPSEVVLVNFRAGVPIPPTNIQLFSIVTAAATNALPPAPKLSPLPMTQGPSPSVP